VKFFLLLTLCSIAAFVFVLRTRPEVFSTAYSSSTPAITPISPIVPEKKNASAVRSRTVRSERTIEAVPVAPTEPNLNTKPEVNARPRHFAEATVTADTLPVYVTNSSRSRVLRVLNKGDHVQRDLAVIDSVGHWSLITVPGQRLSGYVRTEDIDMIRTASQN
jgi:hypothetical protein